jgi:DNA mismatch repair protein MSH2
MDKEHRRVSKDLDQEREKKLFLESHKVHGWCFRLTRNEAGSIRNKKEYKEIATQKNGVYFTTNKLKDLNRDMDQATQNYDRTQRGLVDEVVNVAGELSGSSQRFW